MEIKIVCSCGQKIAFDVEPVNGQMPFALNCPVCGIDDTAAANSMIAAKLSAAPGLQAPPPPTGAPTPAGLQIRKVETPPIAPPQPFTTQTASARPTYSPGYTPQGAGPKPKTENSMVLGIMGAGLGAGISFMIVFIFAYFTGFSMPLAGTMTGALTGLGARIFYRGCDSSLGAISAAIAIGMMALGAFLFPGIYTYISMIFGVIFAWRVAA